MTCASQNENRGCLKGHKVKSLSYSLRNAKHAMPNHKILFIFLDGFGLGQKSEINPVFAAATPFLDSLLQQSLTEGIRVLRKDLTVLGIDACCGVEGLPQSATGQTALFTGINAPQVLGHHFPAFPKGKLKQIIKNHALLKQAADRSKRATFANAYSSRYFDLVDEGKRMHSVTTLSVLAANLSFRMVEDLRNNQAVYWDITRERFGVLRPGRAHTKGGVNVQQNMPTVPPNQAGTHLADIANAHDLTIFECFLPDLLGHRCDSTKAKAAIEMLDTFIESVFNSLCSEVTLVLSSDHGNIEDVRSGSHTRNLVPLIAAGMEAPLFKQCRCITDVTPAILDVLSQI